MDPQTAQDVFAVLKEAYDKSGWLGLAAVALTICVRVYRFDLVQNLLPEKFKWDNLNSWSKRGIVFATAGIGAALAALAGGMSWAAALAAAIPVAFGAMGVNWGTKKTGEVLHVKATGKNPEYEPSPFRKSISLLVPIPKVEPSGEVAKP